ncbi:hypothetical protein Tco_1305091, partial [Tanacetum coccineum]
MAIALCELQCPTPTETDKHENLKTKFDPESSIAGFVNEPSEKTELPFLSRMGNFPIPKELASLDENFLAKRCKLGYKASRILRLAQGVVE